MPRCLRCGGEGLPGGCPKCGLDSEKITASTDIEKSEIVKKARWSMVPQEYIGTVWSKQMLIDNHPEFSTNLNFTNYANLLDKLHSRFVSGLVPQVSAYICAKGKMSKLTWAYSCMQFAIKTGLTVAPLLDTIELKRLMTLAGDNPDFKLYGRVRYDSYVTSDVCFITVTKLEKFREAFAVINELIARRSRLGLPTFVISRYSLKQISEDCSDRDIDSILDATSRNGKKFPIVFELN